MRSVVLVLVIVAVGWLVVGCGADDTETVAETVVHAGDVPKMDYAQPESIDTAESYVIPTTTIRRASRSSSRPRSAPASSAAERRPGTEVEGGETRRVASTAYCLTGTMANGQRVYSGAVAMNGVPMGSRWEVVGTGRVYTVADRIGHGSQFDIAMPGNCAAARGYGRRFITIRRVE